MNEQTPSTESWQSQLDAIVASVKHEERTRIVGDLRAIIVEIVAPLIADGRPVGLFIKRKAERVADALLEPLRKDWG